MNEILLSIVIPTKNRYSVLIPTLATICTNITDETIEFVIQDNSINNEDIVFFLKSIKDSRIKYFYKSEDIDAITNFNNAIKNSNGKFLILIGDDDIVNPFISNILKIVNNSDIKCLIYPRPTYYWPDVVFQKEFDFFRPASLQIIKKSELMFLKLSSKKELKYVLSNGGIYLYKLPAVYHGIVNREVLENIYNKFGTYILGPSPDMSLAISLVHELETYHFIDFPLSVAGASYHSAAGMGRRGEHSAPLNNLPSIVSPNISKDWDPNIPRMWNGFTIYAQTIFIVSKYYNVINEVNYFKLYDKILKENYNDIIFIKCLSKFLELGYFKRNFLIAKNSILNKSRRLIFSLPNFVLNSIIRNYGFFANLKHIRNLTDIESCMRWLEAEYRDDFID